MLAIHLCLWCLFSKLSLYGMVITHRSQLVWNGLKPPTRILTWWIAHFSRDASLIMLTLSSKPLCHKHHPQHHSTPFNTIQHHSAPTSSSSSSSPSSSSPPPPSSSSSSSSNSSDSRAGLKCPWGRVVYRWWRYSRRTASRGQVVWSNAQLGRDVNGLVVLGKN